MPPRRTDNLVTSDTMPGAAVEPTAPALDPYVTRPLENAEAASPTVAPAPEAAPVEFGDVVKRGAAPASRPNGSGASCTVRITKTGQGQVHTGQGSPQTYDWNDEIVLPREVGEALEAKHFAEVLD